MINPTMQSSWVKRLSRHTSKAEKEAVKLRFLADFETENEAIQSTRAL
jgi:hypothetical protein